MVWDDNDRYGDAYFQAEQHIAYGLSRHTRSTIPAGATIVIVVVTVEPATCIEDFKSLVLKCAGDSAKGKSLCLDSLHNRNIHDYWQNNDVVGAVFAILVDSEYYGW